MLLVITKINYNNNKYKKYIKNVYDINYYIKNDIQAI